MAAQVIKQQPYRWHHSLAFGQQDQANDADHHRYRGAEMWLHRVSKRAFRSSNNTAAPAATAALTTVASPESRSGKASASPSSTTTSSPSLRARHSAATPRR